MKKRIVFGLAGDVVEELERLGKKHKTSKLNIVRRALGLFMLVDKEVGPGKRLVIENKNQIIHRIGF